MKPFSLLLRSALLALLLLNVANQASAQFGPFNVSAPKLPFSVNAGSSRAASNKSIYPQGYNPMIRSELRFRPVFTELTSGILREGAGAYGLINQFGLTRDFIFYETMLRFQLGRYSLRGEYNFTDKDIRGPGALLKWPQWLGAVEVDFINSGWLRVGMDYDTTWGGPSLSYAIPGDQPSHATWAAPATYGVHALFNPVCCWPISPSVEFRYRWPMEKLSSLTEYEISGGLRFPGTFLGNTAFRGGARWTELNLRSTTTVLEMKTYGVFGEIDLVF